MANKKIQKYIHLMCDIMINIMKYMDMMSTINPFFLLREGLEPETTDVALNTMANSFFYIKFHKYLVHECEILIVLMYFIDIST